MTKASTSDQLRILGLLPTLNPYGGVISVVNLANILVDRGHGVTIASTSSSSHSPLHPRTEPVLIESLDQLSDYRDFDIVMATSWQTAQPIADLSDQTGARAVYFVQDFEPDFYPVDDPRAEAARSTYDLINTRIVKTAYLAGRLMVEGGWESYRIPPGMDLDTFYPRQLLENRPAAVLAMARPNPPAEHRGYDLVQETFNALGTRRPALQLRSFGSEAARFRTNVEVLGRIEPARLPDLYSASSIYIDVSRAHGFGRTGIEAMACGTAAVLSESGGISEYAEHEVNSLVVPVGSSEAAIEAVERLLNDDDLRIGIARAGIETASRYSDSIAATALEGVLTEHYEDHDSARLSKRSP